jgi:tetratricopeptide (TPR) repeat protein
MRDAENLLSAADPAAAMVRLSDAWEAHASKNRDATVPLDVDLLRARALTALDRNGLAMGLLQAALERVIEERGRADTLALLAAIELTAGREPHAVVARAREAQEAAARFGMDGVEARAAGAAARALAAIRVRRLAERELARPHLAGHAELVAAHADVLLAFDERTAAREIYAGLAAVRGTERQGLLGMARVARLTGEFGAAETALDALGGLGPGDLAPRIERARLWSSRRRWEQALGAVDEVLAASPYADRARRWRWERAVLLERIGRREEAVAAYEPLLAEHAGDGVGRASSRALRLLRDRSAGVRPSHRLRSFGTIAQLHNHCGPACCALLLHHFGQPADQAAIGAAIKGERHGTPIHAMRAHLEAAGLAVRRVEIDLTRIKRVVDLGIPVLVEEEYSFSTHVAIAIGYDDRREVLEVQDPMTHELRDTPYEAFGRLRSLSNEGAIVCVPAGDMDRMGALDSISVVETAYLSTTDQAFRALEAGDLDGAERLADAAIAVRRDCRYAWLCKFEIGHKRALGDPGHRPALRELVASIVELWPSEEWPRQLLGEVALGDGKVNEARAAYELAAARDDGDGRNWAMIGECLLRIGRPEDAAANFRKALARIPWLAHANERLAILLEQSGQQPREAYVLAEVACEQSGSKPATFELAARIALQRGDAAAASTFVGALLQAEPTSVFGQVHRARALKLSQRDAEALEVLEKVAPRTSAEALRVAQFLCEFGSPQRALEVAEGVYEGGRSSPGVTVVRGTALAALGRTDDAMRTLRDVLSHYPHHAWANAELGRLLLQARRAAEALTLVSVGLNFHENAEWRVLLAETLLAIGDRETAAQQALWTLRSTGDGSVLARAARVILSVHGLAEARVFVQRARAKWALLPPLCLTARAAEGPGLTEAQRWVLAVGAVIHQAMDPRRLDVIGAAARPSGHGARCLRTWGIHTSEEVRAQMDWFRHRGDRVERAQPDKLSDADLLAWDFMRMNTVASWAYSACLLERDEAWNLMVEASEGIQLAFSSFREIGQAFVRAKRELIPDEDPEEFADAVEVLLGPGGAWHGLAWMVPFNGVRPPEDHVRILDVEAGADLTRTVHEAFADEDERVGTTLRVVLGRGTYLGPVAVEGSVVLDGSAGGVTVEGPGTDDFVVRADDNAGLTLRQVAIRTTEVEDADALGVGDAVLVRLEGCDVSAGERGVSLFNDGVLHILGGRVHSCTRGIAADDGYVLARDVRFESIAEAAMAGCDDAAAGVFGCHFAPSAAGGVHSFRDNDVRRCVFHGFGRPAIGLADNSSARVEACEFHGGECAIAAGELNALRISACLFGNQQVFGIDVKCAKSALIEGCEFQGSAPGAILLRPGTGVVVRRCRFKGTTGVAVEVNGGGSPQPLAWAPRIVDCEVAGSRGGAILAHGGATLRVAGVVAAAFEHAGLEARDAGTRLFATGCKIGSSSAVGTLVWKGGRALLEDCAIRETGGNAIELLEGGELQAERCSATSSRRALEVEGGSRARLLDCTLGPCDGSAVAVFEKSAVWISGGVLRAPASRDDGAEEGEDTLNLQEGAIGLFEAVAIEGHSEVRNGTVSLFTRCKFGPSVSAGLTAYDNGRVVFDSCQFQDIASSAVQASDEASAELLHCDVLQHEGQTAVFAQGGRIDVVGGRLLGGSAAIAEAIDGGRVTLAGVEYKEGAGARFHEENNGRVSEAPRPSTPIVEGQSLWWVCLEGQSVAGVAQEREVTLAQWIVDRHFGRQDAVWVGVLDGGLGLAAANAEDISSALPVIEAIMRDPALAALGRMMGVGRIADDAQRDTGLPAAEEPEPVPANVDGADEDDIEPDHVGR